MSLLIVLLIAMAAGLAGIAIGWFLRFIISLGKKGSMELEIKEMLLSAREESEKITSEAEKESQETLKNAKREAKELEEKFDKTEKRLIKKEDYLDNRQTDIDAEAEELKLKEKEIDLLEESLEKLEKERVDALENISEISKEDARKELLEHIEKNSEEDLMARLQKLEVTSKEAFEEKAKEILTSTIHRLGNTVSSDVFSSSVDIPSEDIKGKIIGKEGRNIKTFEKETGVEIIVDDTPGSVVISSFDPVRRQIAKVALENLVSDGRIQPARIEESVAKAKKEVNKMIKEKGEKAAYECGIFNLDPKIISILGRLYFRTSYGQNV
ncbi:Rnase Y domain-containing protein, partial [Candidatus Pacebacteria bacterium]|nr:Rnase Y domain-containing protein [Candidatus Paceibacterota bacterium]